MTGEFRGLLGIWRWPIVNLLLQLLKQKPSVSGESVKATNTERWTIVKDSYGDIAEIVVKRDFTRNDGS